MIVACDESRARGEKEEKVVGMGTIPNPFPRLPRSFEDEEVGVAKVTNNVSETMAIMGYSLWASGWERRENSRLWKEGRD